MIQIVEDFIDVSEFVNYTPTYTSTNDVWDMRTAQLPPHLGAPLLEKIHKTVNQNLNKPVWADTINYAKWNVGDQQSPHADGENSDGSDHPFPWREFGCVLYLNEKYEGGEIYFPQHDIELKPKEGTLVWFPGTKEYMHGVNKVINGTRLTIASFWGKNPPNKHFFYKQLNL